MWLLLFVFYALPLVIVLVALVGTVHDIALWLLTVIRVALSSHFGFFGAAGGGWLQSPRSESGELGSIGSCRSWLDEELARQVRIPSPPRWGGEGRARWG